MRSETNETNIYFAWPHIHIEPFTKLNVTFNFFQYRYQQLSDWFWNCQQFNIHSPRCWFQFNDHIHWNHAGQFSIESYRFSSNTQLWTWKCVQSRGESWKLHSEEFPGYRKNDISWSRRCIWTSGKSLIHRFQLSTLICVNLSMDIDINPWKIKTFKRKIWKKFFFNSMK